MSDDRTDLPHDPSDPVAGAAGPSDPPAGAAGPSDPLDDRLGPLTTTPVPLVGADRVRARGRQRARRSQALLAGTGVVLIAALGGGAALLVDRDRSTALVIPAVTATPTPSVAPSPDPCATTLPTGVTCRIGPDGNRVLEQVRPAPTDVKPTLFESPSPDAPAPGAVADLPADTLVTETALEEAFPTSVGVGAVSGTWARFVSSRTAQPWTFEPCGVPVGQPTPSFLSGDFRIDEEPGRGVPEGPALRDQISRFESPAKAAATVRSFLDAVDGCPTFTATQTYDGGTTSTFKSRNVVVSRDPYVVARYSVEPAYPWPQYYGVVAVGDLVAVWDYFPGETTDDKSAVAAADLVHQGLCRNTGTC